MPHVPHNLLARRLLLLEKSGCRCSEAPKAHIHGVTAAEVADWHHEGVVVVKVVGGHLGRRHVVHWLLLVTPHVSLVHGHLLVASHVSLVHGHLLVAPHVSLVHWHLLLMLHGHHWLIKSAKGAFLDRAETNGLLLELGNGSSLHLKVDGCTCGVLHDLRQAC